MYKNNEKDIYMYKKYISCEANSNYVHIYLIRISDCYMTIK